MSLCQKCDFLLYLIGYWKIYRVRVGYRVPVGHWHSWKYLITFRTENTEEGRGILYSVGLQQSHHLICLLVLLQSLCSWKYLITLFTFRTEKMKRMEGEFCRAPEAIWSLALSSRASSESLQSNIFDHIVYIKRIEEMKRMEGEFCRAPVAIQLGNWPVTHLPPLSMPLTINITFIFISALSNKPAHQMQLTTSKG